MTAAANLKLTLAGELSNLLDLGSAVYSPKYNASYGLADGTGANQIKQIFSDTRTIAASGTDDLDLAGGLTNAFGASVTFTKIKALIVKASAANVNDVVVGGDGAAALASLFGDVTDTIRVKPGGLFCVVAPDNAGYAVTAGTADILQIANSGSGTGVTYDILILGVTA